MFYTDMRAMFAENKQIKKDLKEMKKHMCWPLSTHLCTNWIGWLGKDQFYLNLQFQMLKVKVWVKATFSYQYVLKCNNH